MADIAALSLGAVGVAIQMCSGVIKGFQILRDVIDMPRDCAHLSLELQVEYVRFLDWSEQSGLVKEENGDKERNSKALPFDQDPEINRPVVMAIVSEMFVLLDLARLDGKYGELKWVPAQRSESPPGKSDDSKITAECRRSQAAGFTILDSGERANVKTSMRPKDLETFEKAIKTPKKIVVKDKFVVRGFNATVALLKGAGNIVKHPIEYQRRLKWVTFKADSFRELLTRIRQLNNYLHESLGDQRWEAMRRTTRDTYLALLQLSHDTSDLKALLRAIQVDHGTSDLFKKLVQFKYQRHQIAENIGLIQSQLPNIRGGVKERNGLSSMVSKYGDQSVWIEWKTYKAQSGPLYNDRDAFKNPQDEVPVASDSQRVKELVTELRATKPDELRVPNCLGYFTSTTLHSFGLVFEIPEEAIKIQPISLLKLLQKKTGEMPSINQRLQLARQLATSLLYWHTANWLHKDLKSDSIVFFEPNTTEERFSILNKPYLSNFEYSRPDIEVSDMGKTTRLAYATEELKLYTHPDYYDGDSHYRKTYDIYSLGIILIEIALWESAGSFIRRFPPLDIEGQKLKPAHVKALREGLLNGKIGSLDEAGVNMGERYYGAVKTCITGLQAFGLEDSLAIQQNDPAIGALLQQGFITLVVDVLNSISV